MMQSGVSCVRRLCVVVLMLGVFTSFAFSGEVTLRKRPEEGRGFLSIGKAFPGIQQLNDAFSPAGFGKYGDALLIGGIGLAFFETDLVFGFDFHFLSFGSPMNRVNNGFDSELDGGALFMNGGYRVFRSGNFQVYPLLGIGFSYLSFAIDDKTSPSFQEALGTPRRGIDMYRFAFAGQVAVGADQLFVFNREEGREGGLALGLRIGYVFDIKRYGWHYHQNDIVSGPDSSLRGAYLAVTLGGGGRNDGIVVVDKSCETK